MELLIQNVLQIGADEFYRSFRYEIPLSVMLINSDDDNAFAILDVSTRQTDIVQQLRADLIVVFLTHTDYDHALLFIENMEKEFKFTSTIIEFQGSEIEFVQNIFMENSKKIVY